MQNDLKTNNGYGQSPCKHVDHSWPKASAHWLTVKAKESLHTPMGCIESHARDGLVRVDHENKRTVKTIAMKSKQRSTVKNRI